MNRRRLLNTFSLMVWVTPVITTVSTPLHAVTSDTGIMISVEMPVPEFIIMISDDRPNFSYTYQLNNEEPISGDSGAENSVTINDFLTGQFAGTTQVVTVSVIDDEGNMVEESFTFVIEG